MNAEFPRIITLLTDFGTGVYTAQMKGVLYSRCPMARIVDVTHDVPPQDVEIGARILADTAEFFPLGTIHVAVIDPGVGSERALTAVQAAEQFFLCPNNGLLTFLLRKKTVQEARIIQNSRLFLPNPSATFHGRDILAPTAAFLAEGGALEEVGEKILLESLVTLNIFGPELKGNGIFGRILYADSFGNLVTNISREDLPSEKDFSRFQTSFSVNPYSIRGISRTYSDSPTGTLTVLFGSQNLLEIACVNGSAARETGLVKNAEIHVAWT